MDSNLQAMQLYNNENFTRI
jgi:SAM-dependent methyltransferase